MMKILQRLTGQQQRQWFVSDFFFLLITSKYVVDKKRNYHQRLLLEAWFTINDKNTGNYYLLIADIYKTFQKSSRTRTLISCALKWVLNSCASNNLHVFIDEGQSQWPKCLVIKRKKSETKLKENCILHGSWLQFLNVTKTII